MQKQPTLNIGLIGHVAHGKSSLVRSITNEHTARKDSRCTTKNITVQVGYSNAKIYKCDICAIPACYASTNGSSKKIPNCPTCNTNNNMNLIKHISFVDCPGHECLMRNMISGSAIMDGALMVIASNEVVPQPQTAEHMIVADIMGINDYIVIQNKVDLLKNKHQAESNKQDIDNFIKNTHAENSPIIPTSFSPALPLNVDVILHYLATKFDSNPNAWYEQYPLFMYCIRSFDINKPGSQYNNIKGGVIGGSIMNGELSVGDKIEIRPGLIVNNKKTGKVKVIPIITTVCSLMTDKTSLQTARRGGLIAIGTTLDPSLTKNDRMVGMCIGKVNQLPDIGTEWTIRTQLLKYALGTDDKDRVRAINVGERLQISIGSGNNICEVIEKVSKKVYKVRTKNHICPVAGQSMALSRAINKSFRIIGKCRLVN